MTDATDFRYRTDCGREVAFANEAAYEEAIDWYNSSRRSKSDLVAVYNEVMGDGAIYDNADCLTDDWEELCMAAYAHAHIARAPFVWRA